MGGLYYEWGGICNEVTGEPTVYAGISILFHKVVRRAINKEVFLLFGSIVLLLNRIHEVQALERTIARHAIECRIYYNRNT